MTFKCECGCGKEYSDEEHASPEAIWQYNVRKALSKFCKEKYIFTLKEFQAYCETFKGFIQPHNQDEWLVTIQEGLDKGWFAPTENPQEYKVS